MTELVLHNVSYKYDSQWIIKNFSFRFANNLYFITAPNGRGKTTLLRILAGELTPLQGNIELFINEKKIPYNLFYKNISFLTPSMQIPENIKVYEILNYYYNTKNLNISREEFLKIMKLKKYEKYKIFELSSGTQQRLLLGLTVFTDKQILILDEPTSNLDDENAKLFFNILHKSSKNKVIIVASNLKREEVLLQDFFDIIKISL